MTAVGGSIESVSIRGRLFPVAADADATLKLGGFENEVQANGDGSARIVKSRVPWGIDGLQIEIDHDRADLQFLWEVSAEQDYVVITLTMASGHTYQGRGMITGEFGGSTQSATAPVNMMGPGEATLQ